jgi:TolB-like protein
VPRLLFPLLAAAIFLVQTEASAEDQVPHVKVSLEGKGKNTRGNGDDIPQANETLRLVFTVVNAQDSALSDHKIVFEGTGASLSPGEFKLPTIPSKSQVRGETLLRVGGNPEELRITATIAPAKGGAAGFASSFVLQNNQLVSAAEVESKPQTAAAAERIDTIPQAVDALAQQILQALPKQGMADTTIAISPFVNLGATASEKKLGQIVAELLVTRLSERPNLRIIERGQIEAILEELKLSMLGLTESSNAEKVGKLLGAEAMIVGSVSEVGDRFAISARQIDVGSGKVLFAKEVELPQAGAIALSSKYVVTRSRSDGMFRSLLVPGWGQFYNNEDAKGYVFLGTTAALIGVGVFQRMQYSNTHDEYMSATSRKDADRLYDQRNSEYNTSNLFFLIAGGVWAVNVVEAYLSGTSASDVEIPKEEKPDSTAGIQPVISIGGDTKVAGLQLRF